MADLILEILIFDFGFRNDTAKRLGTPEQGDRKVFRAIFVRGMFCSFYCCPKQGGVRPVGAFWCVYVCLRVFVFVGVRWCAFVFV